MKKEASQSGSVRVQLMTARNRLGRLPTQKTTHELKEKVHLRLPILMLMMEALGAQRCRVDTQSSSQGYSEEARARLRHTR